MRPTTTRLRPSLGSSGDRRELLPSALPTPYSRPRSPQPASDWPPGLGACAERDWSVASSNRRRAVGFKSRALGLRSLASFESLRRPQADVQLPAPAFLLLPCSPPRRQDGPQADLLLGQVLRRALRVPVSSARGGRPRREVRPGGQDSGPLGPLVLQGGHALCRLSGLAGPGETMDARPLLSPEFTTALARTGLEGKWPETPRRAFASVLG